MGGHPPVIKTFPPRRNHKSVFYDLGNLPLRENGGYGRGLGRGIHRSIGLFSKKGTPHGHKKGFSPKPKPDTQKNFQRFFLKVFERPNQEKGK